MGESVIDRDPPNIDLLGAGARNESKRFHQPLPSV